MLAGRGRRGLTEPIGRTELLRALCPACGAIADGLEPTTRCSHCDGLRADAPWQPDLHVGPGLGTSDVVALCACGFGCILAVLWEHAVTAIVALLLVLFATVRILLAYLPRRLSVHRYTATNEHADEPHERTSIVRAELTFAPDGRPASAWGLSCLEMRSRRRATLRLGDSPERERALLIDLLTLAERGCFTAAAAETCDWRRTVFERDDPAAGWTREKPDRLVFFRGVAGDDDPQDAALAAWLGVDRDDGASWAHLLARHGGQASRARLKREIAERERSGPNAEQIAERVEARVRALLGERA